MVKLVRNNTNKYFKKEGSYEQENINQNTASNTETKEDFVKKSELLSLANQMFHKYDFVFKRLSE